MFGLEISKPIHFWNCEIIRDQKLMLAFADTVKAAILDFQSDRHKISILRYLSF